jgi:hypothetical protein
LEKGVERDDDPFRIHPSRNVRWFCEHVSAAFGGSREGAPTKGLSLQYLRQGF